MNRPLLRLIQTILVSSVLLMCQI